MRMSVFYKHYKNKPYKFHGTVRHSETLDELVLYETLYENKLGSMWVRPKDMFFENVQVEHKMQPRFAQIQIEYRQSTSSTDENQLRSLIDKVFGSSFDHEKIPKRLSLVKDVCFQTAWIENRLVGFKLGYALNEDLFYSWLGGVAPEFRGLGIAQGLMEQQHKWCLEKKYNWIETRTKNRWRSMLILNLKNDFKIVGTLADEDGEPKIVLRKKLKS